MDEKVAKHLSGLHLISTPATAATGNARQVGDLVIEHGIAKRGLLIRHLVIPENSARSDLVFKEIAKLSIDTYINIMAQYHPAYRAREHPALGRHITLEEFNQALQWAQAAGLWRFDR